MIKARHDWTSSLQMFRSNYFLLYFLYILAILLFSYLLCDAWIRYCVHTYRTLLHTLGSAVSVRLALLSLVEVLCYEHIALTRPLHMQSIGNQ